MSSFLTYITLTKILFHYEDIRYKFNKVMFSEPLEPSMQRHINMDYFKQITYPLIVTEDFVVIEPDGTTKVWT